MYTTPPSPEAPQPHLNKTEHHPYTHAAPPLSLIQLPNKTSQTHPTKHSQPHTCRTPRRYNTPRPHKNQPHPTTTRPGSINNAVNQKANRTSRPNTTQQQPQPNLQNAPGKKPNNDNKTIRTLQTTSLRQQPPPTHTTQHPPPKQCAQPYSTYKHTNNTAHTPSTTTPKCSIPTARHPTNLPVRLPILPPTRTIPPINASTQNDPCFVMVDCGVQ
ncbi:mucin-2-like [Homalodisca vitripennis]|uniref:mucin-2-like n=1 Tax=Homalodisca vitripennis TaxID=197043 RepID=UPI001EECA0DC|nr:mucin-2-like [Homalodisca vitripennis]